MISVETVTQVWQEVVQTQSQDAFLLMENMLEEQPEILSYLMALESYPLNRHEAEQILYIGTVVWRIMRRSERQLRMVTCCRLERAESANEDFLNLLEADTEADFANAARAMFESYPEPEVLRYILEALNEEKSYEADDPLIREEYRGLAFAHLKTVLDALINSLEK